MSGKGQEKQANRKKNKNAPKEQTAQTPPIPASRDTAAKPDGASRDASETPLKPATPGASPRPLLEKAHVPMNRFNAAEIEAMLSSGAADGGEIYKPNKPLPNAGGVWGAKPTTMANGKDFWLELRKQVAELQAKGGVARGDNKK